jgi:prevent-host-death family protein
MHIVNIHEAKTTLSRLLAEVQQGGEVVIAKAGKPIGRLTAYEEAPAKPLRKAGGLKGKIWIAPDFDAPDPELERLFYDAPLSSDSDEG